TKVALGGRLYKDPERAEECAGKAVYGAARDRRHQAGVDGRCAGRDREVRRASERECREHWGAAFTYDHGEVAGRSFIRGSGFKKEDSEGGRGVRSQAIGRHRERSGLEQVYPVTSGP